MIRGMEKEYLTAEQVGKKLQMHPTIIRKMLAEGRLPGRKLGKGWRVVASELRDFMMRKPAASEGGPDPGRTGTAGD